MKRQLLLAAFVSLMVACVVDEPESSRRTGDHIAADDPVASDRLTDSPPAAGGDGWIALMPGATCNEHADCDSAAGAGDGFCYRGDMGGSLVFPDAGYCTIDDGTGAVCGTDEDCPGASRCISAEGYRLCLPACGPDDACPSGQACMTEFGGLPINAPACLPGNAAAVDGDVCAGFYDCNASSLCWNDIENPSGYCQAYNCTLGTNAGCNGGICIEYTEGPSTGTVCVAACTSAADCRADEGYVCHDPDGPGGAAAYCRHPHVGDACATDLDCGNGSGALVCLTDGWSGGSCSKSCLAPGSIDGCSSGSLCVADGQANVCADRCPLVGSTTGCRDGYTCEAAGVVNGGVCRPI